jgi:MbtH protein
LNIIRILAITVVLLGLLAGCSGKSEEAPIPLTPPLHPSGFKFNQDEMPDYTIYQSVVNTEWQYSIWPAQRELALGWSSTGFIGSKTACLQYIEDIWIRYKWREMDYTPPPTCVFQIMVNQNEPKLKYIIWDMEAAYGFSPGYSSVGYTGLGSDCIAYIQARNPK